MAVTLTGSNGLFTRLGKLFKVVERVNTHQTDASAGIKAEIEDVLDEYSSADMEYASSLSKSDEDWQKSAANIYTAIRSVASDTLIGMVDDDATLSTKTIYEAGRVLKEQMESASASIKGNVFSAAVDVGGSNTGNGKLTTSFINGEGFDIQSLRADTIKLRCTRDAQVSGTTSRETFVVIESKPRVTDIRDVDWPGGYGLKGSSFIMSDPSYSQSTSVGRSAIANGDFNDFSTSNTPDNWTIVEGAAGDELLEEGSVKHLGDKSLEIVGNKSTLMDIKQVFGNSGNTTVKLRPEERYMLAFWLFRTTGADSGVIKVGVEDGSGSDLAAGSSSADSIATENTANAWNHKAFAFSTPKDIPDSPELHVEMTTQISEGYPIYVDGLQLIRMPKAGGSYGFHYMLSPGTTDWIIDDEITLTITKTTTGKFSTYLDKFLGFGTLGLQLPVKTDASETISDSLIA